MEKSDYDAMAKNIEEETFQRTRMNTALGSQGTWSRREDFQEFDSINLEDNRTSRKMSENCRDNYKTIKSDNTKKETTLLCAKLGIVLIYIPHYDIMSVEHVKSLANGHHEAVDQIIEESNQFFAKSALLSLKHPHNAKSMLDELDKLYSKDHLRIVGSSVVFRYQMDKNASGEHTQAKLIFPNIDVIEYLASETNPHIPLLDFSKFENPDQEPQLKFDFNTRSTIVDETKTFIYLGKCRCELDLSIVDRIADLFEPRPFFDLPSCRRS
ncbi:unnamed protein product, partial [Cylicostephanus goldi]